MATDTAVINMEPRKQQPVAPSWHTLILLLILGAMALFGYKRASDMRLEAMPHRISYYAETMAVQWLMFGYVVFGIRRKGITLRELLGPKWKGGVTILANIGIALAFWLSSLLILGIAGHLLQVPKDQMQSMKFMVPHTGVELAVWILLSITAGVCEETIFRGYLQQQFIAWTKSVPAGVIFSAIIFGLGHIYQGLRQAGVIAIFGILFGILAAWRRDVKLGMLAHGWQDSLAGIGEFLATKGYIHIPGM